MTGTTRAATSTPRARTSHPSNRIPAVITSCWSKARAVSFRENARIAMTTTPLESAMKYLCQIFFDEKNLNALPETELGVLVDQSLDYDDRLRTHQHLIAAQAVEPVSTAKTVRLRRGEVSVTDGPFAE